MKTIGTIGTIGTIRPDATEEISAEGEDYTDARSANKKIQDN